MANEKISASPSADLPLDGTELVPVVQDGDNKHCTAQDIADLAPGGVGAVSSVFGRTGAVVSATNDYTAAQVANVAAGGVSATTVQAAINELDTEKAPIASPTLTGTPAAPTPSSGDSTTKIATTAFVQNEISGQLAGLKWKTAVKVATTTNGTLATGYENGDTVDGVALATGDRILIKNQTTQTENGIYVVNASGAPTRSTDADTGTELQSAVVSVDQGTTNADTSWRQTTDSVTVGSSNIVWTVFGSSSGVSSFNSRTGAVSPTSGDYTAAQVTNIPAGNIGSTTVQAALNELDTEKLSLAGGTMSGPIAMGNNNVTDLPGGTAAGHALRYEQLINTPTVLTDGASVSWELNKLMFPMATWLCATATTTLAFTTSGNVLSGAQGLLKLTTNTASAITLTFPAGFTHKMQNVTFTTYTFPAGTGKDYTLAFYVVGTTLEWVISVVEPRVIQAACSDEITPLNVGTNKIKFRMPYAMTLTGVRASLSTAQSTNGPYGGILTIDINESGTSILSTKLTIDNTEKTSVTAVTAAVISDTALADDAEISVDIDQVGDGTATGLKITLLGV